MNRLLLIVLLVPFLSACGTRTVKDDAPANDLDALVSNVRKDATPVKLPNGRDYCMELATTEDEQDACGGDLEDALFIANKRLASIVDTVTEFVGLDKLRRNPCSWWERVRGVDRCKPKNSAAP